MTIAVTPTERNQCQAKLDILIEGFLRADWAAYRDAVTWLRDFADQKNIDAGRVMCGGVWSTPQTIEAVRESARMRQLEKDAQRRDRCRAFFQATSE